MEVEGDSPLRVDRGNKVMKSNFIVFVFFIVFFTGCATSPLAKPNKTSRIKYIQVTHVVDQKIKEAIIAGKVIEGMTYDQVRAAWGEPDKVYKNLNEVEPNSGMKADEQWIYRWDIFSTNKIVHFYNGIVIWVEYDYT